jgi:hypothetical protein
MKLLVDIVDNEAIFGMKVLKSLSFIRKAKPVSSASAQLLSELNEAAEEVRLNKQEKLKLKCASELLNEI